MACDQSFESMTCDLSEWFVTKFLEFMTYNLWPDSMAYQQISWVRDQISWVYDQWPMHFDMCLVTCICNLIKWQVIKSLEYMTCDLIQWPVIKSLEFMTCDPHALWQITYSRDLVIETQSFGNAKTPISTISSTAETCDLIPKESN